MSAEAVSDPIGFNKVTIKANSDSIVSSAFHQKAVFAGVLESDPTENGDEGLLAPANPPTGGGEWTNDQFVGSHYLIFTSGERKGHFYEIAANSATTVTLTLAGVVLLDIDGDANKDVAQGDGFAIIPHWTLSSLFPNGDGIPSSTQSAVNGEVFYTANDQIGLNKPIGKGFFYFDEGGVTGWFDSSSFQPADDFVIPPLAYIVVRNNTDTDLTLCNSGRVSLYPHVLRLRRSAPNDQYLTLQRPVPVNLGNLGYPMGLLSPRLLVLVMNCSSLIILSLEKINRLRILIFSSKMETGMRPVASRL